MSSPSEQKKLLKEIIVVLGLISLAMGVRYWPLGALELRIPWVTFYPAVMAIALYGGFGAGLTGTVLSVLAVLFWSPTGMPFIDDRGDLLGLLVFTFNGTLISLMSGAMHKANERARQAREMAESANRAKSAFLSNMSHELRTPLNAILGFSNILKECELGAEEKRYLSIISTSGDHLLNLINNVLDISKIEAGHLILEESPFSFSRFLFDLKSLMAIEANKKKLTLTAEFDDVGGDSFILDCGKLRQILLNLVGNAIKFTDSGGVSIRAKIQPRDGNPNLVEELATLSIEVEDSGCGIPKERLQGIFKPFERVLGQFEKRGSGLGLSICKQYVELMGGDLGVRSEPGLGSCFTLTLPVRHSKEILIEKRDSCFRKIVGLKSGQPRVKILIAEDKEVNRLLLTRILEPIGFLVESVENGEDAVASYQNFQPDLIWMDIRMPIMDGKEATKKIRQLEKEGGRSVKIIALTAHALEEERLEILEAGCDDFIRKPYRDYEIFHAVERHLGLKYRYQEVESRESASAEREEQDDTINLDVLPEDLITRLKAAALVLDFDKTLAVCSRISEHDNRLGMVLKRWVEDYRFEVILAAVEDKLGDTAKVGTGKRVETRS